MFKNVMLNTFTNYATVILNSKSEIEVFKPCANELMTLEQKFEFADRFTDLVEQLQQEESELNSNFKAFIDELSTTQSNSRSTRNSKNKRRGISDNEVRQPSTID